MFLGTSIPIEPIGLVPQNDMNFCVSCTRKENIIIFKVVRLVVFLSFLIGIIALRWWCWWCLLMRARPRICHTVGASFGLWSGLSGPVDCIPDLVHVKTPKTDVFDEIHLPLSSVCFYAVGFGGSGGSRVAAVIYDRWDARASLSLGDRCFIARNSVSFVCLGEMQRKRIQLAMPCDDSAMGWLAPPPATTSRGRCGVATLFLCPAVRHSSSSYTAPGSRQTGKRRTNSDNKEQRNNWINIRNKK